MILLEEVITYLDQELKTATIPDYPGAINGLQLANQGQIARVVAAVDASLPAIELAAEGGAGLLVVHHGLFWQGTRPVTGPLYRKLKIAMDAGLAIYSSHLPLDIHPVIGNNILLAAALAVTEPLPFFEKNGVKLGIRGNWQGSREQLTQAVSAATGAPVHLCPGGPSEISKIAIITGGAGNEVEKVAASGVDTFITGEGGHWTYPLAQELGVNLLYAGHYATETFGVRKLMEILSNRYQIPGRFIDLPTGI